MTKKNKILYNSLDNNEIIEFQWDINDFINIGTDIAARQNVEERL